MKMKKKDYDKVSDIVSYLNENGELTPKEAEKVCGKASAAVRRYLKMLVGTGYVEIKGNTGNLVYRVRENQEQEL